VRAVIGDGFKRKPKRNGDLQKSNFMTRIFFLGVDILHTTYRISKITTRTLGLSC
jgi:hypothetical protein